MDTTERNGVGVACVVGAVTPPGRLARAVDALATSLGDSSPDVHATVVDLSAARPELCDGRPLESYDEATQEVVGAVARAHAVVIASPVYRASLTGVLKNFLDLLPVEALANKPVGIVAMGASDHHYLGVDSHLRAILAWFGALTAPTSVYLTSADFAEGRPVDRAVAALGDLGATVVELARATRGLTFGPAPLAARARS